MATAERHPADTTRSGVAPGALSRLLEELVAAADDASDVAEVPLASGERLGRFEITRQIGRGGFGVVYEARDPELGRSVALKTLRPARAGRAVGAADGLALLRREAEAVARLDHPAIVTIFDVGSWPGGGFLVMELLRGETLSKRLSRGAPGLDEALTISEAVARALAHAHDRGVLHRDLKPANVFLTDDGRVKLLDFGIAHLLGRADVSDGSGTPEYMAPEQLDAGRCDARADVYAAALMLAEMLAGTRLDPGQADVAAELTGRGHPRKVAVAVAAALSADPDGRPQDGEAWLASLRALRRDVDRRERLRRGLRLAAAALVLASVAGLASWSVWRGRDPSGPLTIVVGDVTNETGDPELGAVSELIATSLRQSQRLRVLSRDAVGEHLRALARGPADRIDEALARGLGKRAAARAVLLGSLRRVGEAYALEVRGLDPRLEQYAFTVSEQARGKEVIFELVDRTALAVRRALEEPDEDVRAADEKIGELVTRSLAAYQEYAEGLSCRQRGAEGCRRHLERAVEIDPTFAMAQYELAVAAFWGPDFAGQGLPAIRQAVLHVNRAPERERIKIRAFAAWAEGREQDADRLYREAAARHPDDFFVLKMAAGFLLTRDEPDRALPLQRRAVELAPVSGLGMLELADALSALGRADELAALEATAGAVATSGGPPEAALAVAVARRSRGDSAGAVEAARMALAVAASAPAREEARMDVWIARIEAGDLAVEAELRGQCDHEASYQLLTLLGLSGRRAEAIRTFESGDRPECPPRSEAEWRQLGNALFHHAALTRFAAGFADVERARRHARRAAQRNPALGPHLAVYLAYAGDAETAAELARGLDPGSPRHQGYEAVALWRRGEREQARELLRTLASRTAWSSTPHVLPPSFLYGELSAELGDDAAAIEALERFGALHFYRLDFWSWAYPRSLYLLARSYDRTGDTARARDRVEKLLTLWRSADVDQPLLAEARALGARLGVVVDGT